MPNTSLNTSDILIAYNAAGIPLAFGDVVVPSDAADKAITTTTDPDYAGLVGVVIDPGGIAVAGRGAIAFKGYVPQVNLINSASRLDELTTSASPGKGQATPGAINSFGIAMSSASEPEAYLYGPSFRDNSAVDYGEVGGRLTLTTATPVTTSDVTGAATLYYTPHRHNQIGLYVGGAWSIYATDEVSISLASLTSGKNYDVFAYYTGSAVALELVEWTNDTTRATALARQDGVWTKSGDATRRYLGTIRASGAGTCEDSAAKRFVWNAHNRARRILYRRDESAVSWVAAGGWRMANNSASNRVEVVVGLSEVEIDLTIGVLPGGGAVNLGMGVAVGEDSTTTPTNTYAVGQYLIYMSTITVHVVTHFRKMPAIGYHYYQWLEYGNGGTFYSYRTATPPDPDIISGMMGDIEG